MGYNSSSSIEEIEFKKEIDKKNGNSDESDEDKNIDKKGNNIIKEVINDSEEEKENDKENNNSKKGKEKETKENSEVDKKNKNNKNDKESNKESNEESIKEKNDKLKIKKFDNKNKNLGCALSTDDNKEISNINTEGINSENKKLNLHKQYYEGVTLMKGVEEYIPEELNEDDILGLVEDAIHGNKLEGGGEEKENEIAKITTEQTKAISKILYNKIHKKEVNMKDFPELKGIKVKIAVEKLTKDVIRKMMFNEKKVDDCQIDLTYLNLTKDNEDIKALTIEILP